MNIYVVYDRIASVYSKPLFFESEEVAVTNFKRSCASDNFRRPSDLDLIYIGTYSDKSGEFNFDSVKRIVCTGSDIWLEEAISQSIARLNEATERYNQACVDYMKMIKGDVDNE